ncbi:patatin-like phospholipase family protein (plasmid) [Streptomyces sp. Qhu-G9]|uniref:patatin-like phospholipase family protein n=1 Tax=Streptomyces sp. Qhu-G9 TaxID=3452799 RepID=UPI0022AC10C8|nr:patatin-like phospholipase family protein [Streptomyces aurantiacus]WAU78328.1 patatin-like phospholipase family protein [Streptomyces aurantiacus]
MPSGTTEPTRYTQQLPDVSKLQVGLCATATALGLGWALVYLCHPLWWNRPKAGEVGLQLAGNGARAREVLTKQEAPLFLEGIWQDWVMFIPGYTLLLAGAFSLGRLLLYRDSARLWALRGLVLTGVMALADAAGENLFLAEALGRIKNDTYPDLPLAAAACFALLKWTLAVPLAVTAFWVLGLLLARGLRPPQKVISGKTGRTKPKISYTYDVAADTASGEDRPDVIVPPLAPHDWVPRGKWTAPPPKGDSGTEPDAAKPTDSTPQTGDRSTNPGVAKDSEPPTGNSGTQLGDSALARWRTRAYRLPGRKPAESGFCVSGGGIRSAAVTMGALQALRRHLLKSRYLVAVSGGGYTAGALQLALTPQPTGQDGNPIRPQEHLATLADAFAAGSPEEDHVRRHAKYLADSPKEYLVAAGTVLRGLALSFSLLTLAFAALGQYLRLFYTHLPLTDLSRFIWRAPKFTPTCRVPVEPACFREQLVFPALKLYPHAWVSVLALLGLAGVLSVVFALWQVYGLMFRRPWHASGRSQLRDVKSRRPWQRSTVTAVVGLAAAVSIYVIVLPAVIWFFTWLAGWQWVPGNGGRALGLLGAVTAAATALGTLFVTAYRGVKKVLPTGEKAPLRSGGKTLLASVGSRGWIRAVVCWLVLLLVAFFGLALMSWTVVHSGRWHWAWQAGVPVVLIVLAVSIDQTVFSLHPFYRRRLAGAFSLRRAVLRDGSVGVLPYDYFAEGTPLSRYAARVEKEKETFPQVLFVASAAVSTRNRTAPGRPAVPFTFAADYVGGPDTGWVRTDTMEKTAPPLIARDLTVQSAVAASGAAFASAMGTQTTFMERLLALTNLRLGTWIPNPLYLAELVAQGPDHRLPRLPWVRRLRYQLQELVNRYSDTTPLLLCTDGGHFDNLGLVELLRLRCRTVFVIDASGDDPPLATTLAQAVTLAYEELGVRITFDGPDDLDPLDLVPGSGTPRGPEEPMKALNARFSKRCAVRGTITYPERLPFSEGKPPDDKGTIIFAKANLTSDMPYELLSYAVEEEAFPRISTMDQWFDHTQFDAYRALGHFMGTQAADLTPRPPREP